MSAIDFFRYFSAPLVGMVAIIVAIRNSKSYKLKRIDRLSFKKHQLENAIIRKYGFQRQSTLITREDEKIRHMNEQIEMLKRSL